MSPGVTNNYYLNVHCTTCKKFGGSIEKWKRVMKLRERMRNEGRGKWAMQTLRNNFNGKRAIVTNCKFTDNGQNIAGHVARPEHGR